MMHVDLFLLPTIFDFPSHGFMERTFPTSWMNIGGTLGLKLDLNEW
jgi:hypothetical protein